MKKLPYYDSTINAVRRTCYPPSKLQTERGWVEIEEGWWKNERINAAICYEGRRKWCSYIEGQSSDSAKAPGFRTAALACRNAEIRSAAHLARCS